LHQEFQSRPIYCSWYRSCPINFGTEQGESNDEIQPRFHYTRRFIASNSMLIVRVFSLYLSLETSI